MQTIAREIVGEVPLCDPAGRLNPEAVGWSRHPVHICNLKGRFLRKKQWDYWCITSDRLAFSATIANVDYMAIGAAYLLEYGTKRFVEKTVTRPFSRTPTMPPTVSGDIDLEHGRLALSFRSTPTGVQMEVRSDDFGGKRLHAEFRIVRPLGHQTLNVVVPWDSKTFQFTSKQHCLPTTGTVTWGPETFVFSPETSFACLDFGRGIWPYRTAWNWAAFSGRSGKDVIGINMGAKWTDGTGMNENGIVLNGALHKVFDDILFEYDRRNVTAPWRMKTVSSDTIDLTFMPFYDRATATNLLILRSAVHQCFGYYSGVLKIDERSVRVDRVVGWAEEHLARW